MLSREELLVASIAFASSLNKLCALKMFVLTLLSISMSGAKVSITFLVVFVFVASARSMSKTKKARL